MQFDLKQADVYFVDGYTNTGAVNHMAGYSPAVSTMAVDLITGAIPLGATFTLASDTLGTVYSVTAKTDTLGATVSITFSPALVEAVTDDEVITFGGRRLKLKIGDGTVSYDETRVVEYKKDRGLLDTVRLGDQEPLDVKMDLRWEFLRSDASDPVTSSIPSPEEVIKQTGAASTWTTSAADPCEPFAINIYILYTPLCSGVKKEATLLKDFRYEKLGHDLKQGMLSTSGKCNVQQATVTRI